MAADPPAQPAEFAQPFGPANDGGTRAPGHFGTLDPAVSVLFPDYRLNIADEIEVIYHVRTGVSPETYRLKVQDQISIQFPYQTNYNQNVTVQSDGTIRLLLVGEILVVQRGQRGLNQFHFRQDKPAADGSAAWLRYDPATREWRTTPSLRRGPDDQWLTTDPATGREARLEQVLATDDPLSESSTILIDTVNRNGSRDRFEFDHIRQRWRPRPVFVAQIGMTARDLEDELRKRYSEHLRSPELTVTITQANIKIEELKRAITTAPRGQSRLMPVKPDGTIDLPFMGEVLAFGKTIQQLKQDIETAYEQVDLPEISVTVQMNQWAPQKIFVLGEVVRPGLLTVPTSVTLMQALAASGGPNPRAAEQSIMVIRRKGLPVPQATIVDLRSILRQTPNAKAGAVPDFSNLRYDFYLADADIVYVPSSTLASTGDWVDMVFNRIVRNIMPYNFYTGLNFGYELHRETSINKSAGNQGPNTNIQLGP